MYLIKDTLIATFARRWTDIGIPKKRYSVEIGNRKFLESSLINL